MRFSISRSRTSCFRRRLNSPRWDRPAPISRRCASCFCDRRRPRSGFGQLWPPATSTRPWPRRSSRSRPIDEKFYDHLPFLMPHRDMRSYFTADLVKAARAAFQNGTLQVAYLIIALRAVGLDTGPMTGFDNAKVDAEFFPEGTREVERPDQYRLRRPREAVPAQPAVFLRPDGEDHLIACLAVQA